MTSFFVVVAVVVELVVVLGGFGVSGGVFVADVVLTVT